MISVGKLLRVLIKLYQITNTFSDHKTFSTTLCLKNVSILFVNSADKSQSLLITVSIKTGNNLEILQANSQLNFDIVGSTESLLEKISESFLVLILR